MDTDAIGVGIAGLGRSGWDIHAALLAELPEHYRVAAALDQEASRREEAAERFGCNTYPDCDAFLADPGVELVVVATPSFLHARHSIAALEAGRHVLCEKPMATSLAQADEMTARARSCGRILAVFQNRRYDPAFIKVQEVAQSGILGRILVIRMASHSFSRRRDWQTLTECGGGIVNNSGAHALDGALLLIGDEEPEVTCQLAHTVTAGDAEDHAVIVLKCPSGLLVQVEMSSCAALGQDNWFVIGTCGAIQGSDSELTIKWFDPSAVSAVEADKRPPADRKYGQPEEIPWQSETWEADGQYLASWQQVYLDLYRTIREGAAFPITIESVRRQIALISRCKELSPVLDARPSYPAT